MKQERTKLNYQPKDIAIYFLKKSNMSNLRLNKLTYLSFCWGIFKLDAYLFNEPIQAWVHGPVIPSVTKAFKLEHKEYNDEIDIGSINMLKQKQDFTKEEKRLLESIYEEYAILNDYELSDITHNDKKNPTPWQQVYKPHKKRIIIPKELIIEYYSELNLNRAMDEIKNIDLSKNQKERLEGIEDDPHYKKLLELFKLK